MSKEDVQCSTIDVLRGPKIADMPIFDWAGSLLGAFIVGKYVLRLRTASAWSTWIIVWVMLGVAVHYFIGVSTMLGYYLGINARPTRKECKSMIE